MIQLDNLAVQGMANGAISFFSNVMQGLQANYGTTPNGWLNVINDLDSCSLSGLLTLSDFLK